MTNTIMEKEAREAPQVVSRQLHENQIVWDSLADRLKGAKAPFAMTVARGSSDHAATFAKYLLETTLGIVTSSAAPSVYTIYRSEMCLKGSLVIGLSQSGQSPDICEVLQTAKEAGAITVAIVNQVTSPLAEIAEYVVPLWAGDEKAVAATKSYIATLSALTQLIASLTKDEKLLKALDLLPERLEAALEYSWADAAAKMCNVQDTLVVARGYGYPIAQEMALKLKETSAIHAESFSSAEVLHGPFALIKANYQILMLAQNDASLKGTLALAQRITSLGGKPYLAIPSGVIKVEKGVCSECLPLPRALHPMLDPIVAVQSFYLFAAKLAVLRGMNPDTPDNLKKVTETH